MRSKRSKKWHINRETRDARELIERGVSSLAVIAASVSDTRGRTVLPHRSGGGVGGQRIVGVVIDEYDKLKP